jgi:hypothetical protein
LKAFVDTAAIIKAKFLTQGTKENPAETCKELALNNPEAKNGMYWIDPNGGDANDAIEVYCNVKKQETCIYAKPSKVYRGEYRPKAGTTGDYKWFSSDLRDGHAFTYKADSSQMRFMRFKSSQGSQSITYHCKNSIAVLDASTNSYEKALRLLGDNDVEITHNGSHGKSYTVNSDGCQHSKSNRRWSKTKLTFSTSRTERLPLVDFAPFQDGRIYFGLEVGPVCFS